MLEYKNSYMQFDRKGYGRIFVEKEEDIPKLKEIMLEIDEYEFNNYYPGKNNFTKTGELITIFNPEKDLKSIYVHKFDDMDIGKVIIEAWKRGIKCFVIFGKVNQFDED